MKKLITIFAILICIFSTSISIADTEDEVINSQMDSFNISNFIDINDSYKIKLLSIPATNDALDVLDCIIENELKIETIHLQQSNDLLSRLKIFFYMAKAYTENGIKRNIILKHEYLDNFLEKNKKKD